ncbi:HNH endonuclease [Planotetraspora sp. A-T 1434]|nr:HNH endonuclease [Planotetraspora sp. A-T 1434]
MATGQLLPISDVHRLARTSRLVRMVVDAKGQVLNMGRAVRLATPAQRQALIARYATCYCDGCAIPADMAEIDHVNGWINGGATDLEDMAPACTWHNRDKAAHPDRYTTHRNPDGTWTLTHLGRLTPLPSKPQGFCEGRQPKTGCGDHYEDRLRGATNKVPV